MYDLITKLVEIEANWACDPEGSYKHERRDIVDQLLTYGLEISYIFDPEDDLTWFQNIHPELYSNY